ncbi:DEAD/DEAH box helicase, partial [candidate division KSB1 bacterium]|nr:DEAD/DEAH box helicase [candidate division KSB1 bacterium]
VDERGEFDAEVTIDEKSDRKVSYACNCRTFSRNSQCQHVAALLYAIFSENQETNFLLNTHYFYFTQSLFYTLSKNYSELFSKYPKGLSIRVDKERSEIELGYQAADGLQILRFVIPKTDYETFVIKYKHELFKVHLTEIESFFPLKTRHWKPPVFLSSLFRKMQTAYLALGYKTPMQEYLESFWYDLGKIWYALLQKQELHFDFDIEQLFRIADSENHVQFTVLRQHLSIVLGILFANPIHRKCLSKIAENTILDYSINIDDDLNLQFTPILVGKDSGATIPITSSDAIKPAAIIGRFMYIEDYGFIRFERKDFFLEPEYFALHPVTLPAERIEEFTQKYFIPINENRFYYVSPSLKIQHIVKAVTRREIHFKRFQSEWCYLSVKYTIGNQSISFYDIYKAIQARRPYVIAENDWIDIKLPEFDWIRELQSRNIVTPEGDDGGKGELKLTKRGFLKLYSTLPDSTEIKATESSETSLRDFLQFRPAKKAPSLAKCNFQLRDYQALGYSWLWFLYSNGLGGLLCDDMGLGKTYQSIALIHAITKNLKSAKFLIICPTSVLHHWRNKTSLLEAIDLHLYHGADRELSDFDSQKFPVIITSYGIARRDIETLKRWRFDLAIFDEIQSAKNKASQTFTAVNQIDAHMKLGLTGTPIENYLIELKALFDIILPEYLGTDAAFNERFAKPIIDQEQTARRQLLHRLIHPFTLRRTKSQVLSELPPKTEEIRTCELSEDQVKLYRDVLDNRAGELIRQLENKSEKIPYLHIFAVLNYLKQICNHPAQMDESELDYTRYRSGKWELFCELLEESLNSGLKVVIFSQYLNMLALIENYLQDQNIDFATIKGETRNREEMIDRFNTDANCMVFTGSLKAAGLGIDLTGGSVVIHYDRWWNAAREDQATDRVHRIGQTKGVQVFKLVTEGTLEEKIDLLIQKKKQLMEDLVQVDDSELFKRFDREDLLELLRISW